MSSDCVSNVNQAEEKERNTNYDDDVYLSYGVKSDKWSEENNLGTTRVNKTVPKLSVGRTPVKVQ